MNLEQFIYQEYGKKLVDYIENKEPEFYQKVDKKVMVHSILWFIVMLFSYYLAFSYFENSFLQFAFALLGAFLLIYTFTVGNKIIKKEIFEVSMRSEGLSHNNYIEKLNESINEHENKIKEID